jgi:hypothetical protein
MLITSDRPPAAFEQAALDTCALYDELIEGLLLLIADPNGSEKYKKTYRAELNKIEAARSALESSLLGAEDISASLMYERLRLSAAMWDRNLYMQQPELRGVTRHNLLVHLAREQKLAQLYFEYAQLYLRFTTARVEKVESDPNAYGIGNHFPFELPDHRSFVIRGMGEDY